MCEIKIHLQELEQKMWGGGGLCVRGAYWWDTTVVNAYTRMTYNIQIFKFKFCQYRVGAVSPN